MDPSTTDGMYAAKLSSPAPTTSTATPPARLLRRNLHMLRALLKDLGGEWLVRYEIGDMQFTDYWFYVRGRLTMV